MPLIGWTDGACVHPRGTLSFCNVSFPGIALAGLYNLCARVPVQMLQDICYIL